MSVPPKHYAIEDQQQDEHYESLASLYLKRFKITRNTNDAERAKIYAELLSEPGEEVEPNNQHFKHNQEFKLKIHQELGNERLQ